MKKNTIFLFDLDSTVTTAEILPTIAKKINKGEEMQELTEKTMMGEINFKDSFLSRIDILKDIPVTEVANLISEIPVGEKITEFLQKHKDVCYIVTSNLDVWISELMKKIGMEKNYFSSNALVENNKITGIKNILPKESIVKEFKNSRVVAIGDGSNDKEMLNQAEIAIAYGGIRNVAPILLDIADYAIYDEEKLCEFLNRLV